MKALALLGRIATGRLLLRCLPLWLVVLRARGYRWLDDSLVGLIGKGLRGLKDRVRIRVDDFAECRLIFLRVFVRDRVAQLPILESLVHGWIGDLFFEIVYFGFGLGEDSRFELQIMVK